MKLMSRCVNGNTQKIALVNTAGEVSELNQFFSCFDCHDFLQKHRQIHDILSRASAEKDDFQRLSTDKDEVRRVFQHVNPNKATGPDNIAPGVLKLLKGPKGSLFVQRNIENQPNYERLVHNMTFKSNKMSLP